jgi:hypothetical protein
MTAASASMPPRANARSASRLTIMTVDEASQTEKWRCESLLAIRAKNRFWRAAMRPEASGHENFFIAKIRDSESAQRALERHSSTATTFVLYRSNNARIAETIAAQRFL